MGGIKGEICSGEVVIGRNEMGKTGSGEGIKERNGKEFLDMRWG